MQYDPPSPEDLARLKNDLGLSSVQMAKLFGLSGGRHWRKYTGGADPQGISPQALFFGLAQLELSEAELSRVLKRMRQVGAQIDLGADSASPAPDGEQQP